MYCDVFFSDNRDSIKQRWENYDNLLKNDTNDQALKVFKFNENEEVIRLRIRLLMESKQYQNVLKILNSWLQFDDVRQNSEIRSYALINSFLSGNRSSFDFYVSISILTKKIFNPVYNGKPNFVFFIFLVKLLQL